MYSSLALSNSSYNLLIAFFKSTRPNACKPFSEESVSVRSLPNNSSSLVSTHVNRRMLFHLQHQHPVEAGSHRSINGGAHTFISSAISFKSEVMYGDVRSSTYTDSGQSSHSRWNIAFFPNFVGQYGRYLNISSMILGSRQCSLIFFLCFSRFSAEPGRSPN